MQEDFLTGMMDEEDKVLASMMKDQGNTMDYQIQKGGQNGNYGNCRKWKSSKQWNIK